MKSKNKVNTRAKIDQTLGTFLWVIMAVMVINVLWQVASRYLLGEPSSFTDELARYLMIWLAVYGAAFVSGKNMHVAIEVLPSRMNKENRKKLKIFVSIMIALFALFVMIVGGSRLVYISFLLGQKSPSLQIPLALVYLSIPISGLLVLYYKIDDIIKMKHA